jgi:hypothetical protein
VGSVTSGNEAESGLLIAKTYTLAGTLPPNVSSRTSRLLIWLPLFDTFSNHRADNLADIPPANKMDDLVQSSQEHNKVEEDYNIDHLNEGYDFYALFCFEDVPLGVIEDILEETAREMSDVYYYWLADDYSTLPQKREDEELAGTVPPLTQTWRSPFLGSTVEAAFEYVKNAPGKLLNRKHIVFLDKKLFEDRRMLRVYRMEGAEPDFAVELGLDVKPGDITEVGGEAHTTILGLFYDRGTGDWGFNVKDWKDEGLPIG